MTKKILIFTGSSTVGKTTFVKLLCGNCMVPTIKNLPQITTRKAREDDGDFVINYDSDDFQKEVFFVNNKNYGIRYKDIYNYIASEQYNIAITICSGAEILKLPNILETFVILIRFSNNIEEEIKIIRKRIECFFLDKECIFRLKSNIKMIHKYFYNEVFIKNNVNLILNYNDGILNNIKKIETELSIDLVLNKDEMLSEFNKLTQNNRR